MEYEEIKRIIDDMGNSKLSSIDIEFPEGIKISMRKDLQVPTSTSSVKEFEIIKEVEISEETEIKSGNIVKSPMVGTFYSKPSPTATCYVDKGCNVKKGTILCVIEAMKLFNEIESEFDGKIEEVYVKDGEVVDYGKPLFKIVS